MVVCAAYWNRWRKWWVLIILKLRVVPVSTQSVSWCLGWLVLRIGISKELVIVRVIDADQAMGTYQYHYIFCWQRSRTLRLSSLEIRGKQPRRLVVSFSGKKAMCCPVWYLQYFQSIQCWCGAYEAWSRWRIGWAERCLPLIYVRLWEIDDNAQCYACSRGLLAPYKLVFLNLKKIGAKSKNARLSWPQVWSLLIDSAFYLLYKQIIKEAVFALMCPSLDTWCISAKHFKLPRFTITETSESALM